MKYAIIITDGAADVNLKELDGKTPLSAAVKPNIDRIASSGLCGTVKTVPEGISPGSDVAIMSVLGYDPVKYYSGRAPIEAAAKGIKLLPSEIAFRCNLVTIIDDIMKDHSAGNITQEEAEDLMKTINEKMGTKDIRFYSGVSYRNLMILNGKYKGTLTPPHDILDQDINSYLPQGTGAELLKSLIKKSREFLPSHNVNQKRLKQNKNIASSIWFWGEGTIPKFTSFNDKFGLNGAIISAVDLVRGLGILIGWEPIYVQGATGFFDTNYSGKGTSAVSALKDYDIVCVHIEAPDEAGHIGNAIEKIKAIEQIDKHIVGPLLDYFLKTDESFRILILPDHPTPCTIRTHTSDSVPFTIWGSDVVSNRCSSFCEKEAAKTGLHINKGNTLIDFFLSIPLSRSQEHQKG